MNGLLNSFSRCILFSCHAPCGRCLLILLQCSLVIVMEKGWVLCYTSKFLKVLRKTHLPNFRTASRYLPFELSFSMWTSTLFYLILFYCAHSALWHLLQRRTEEANPLVCVFSAHLINGYKVQIILVNSVVHITSGLACKILQFFLLCFAHDLTLYTWLAYFLHKAVYFSTMDIQPDN